MRYFHVTSPTTPYSLLTPCKQGAVHYLAMSTNSLLTSQSLGKQGAVLSRYSPNHSFYITTCFFKHEYYEFFECGWEANWRNNSIRASHESIRITRMQVIAAHLAKIRIIRGGKKKTHSPAFVKFEIFVFKKTPRCLRALLFRFLLGSPQPILTPN